MENERVCLEAAVVIGVGGAGNAFINHMIEKEHTGFRYIAVDTNKRALSTCKAPELFLIGEELVAGLGTGNRPEIGAQAADDAKYELADALLGAPRVYIAGGLGGGTGSGAIPVIAYIAKCLGIPTYVIVSTPFRFDGEKRQKIARKSIENMTQLLLDGLMVYPCNSILGIANENIPMPKALHMIEELLIGVIESIEAGKRDYMKIRDLQIY